MEISAKSQESWAERTEAVFINDLVNKGVIDARRIEEADLVVMGELIKRYGEDIGKVGYARKKKYTFEVPQDVLEKIKTLLGNREKQDPKQTEKITETVREVIERMVYEGYPVTGAIIFGSRVDQAKHPRSNSDLDMIFFIDEKRAGRKLDWNFSDLDSSVKKMRHLYSYTISVADAYDIDVLLSEIEENKKATTVPYWGWNPNAFKFVGSMFIGNKEYKDDEATSYLKGKLETEDMNRRRKWQVKRAEDRIEELVLTK